MKKFPDGVMTSHEKESFLSMLFRALQRIDDHIVMEQHNLSPELCDYLLSIKKAPDSGTFVYDAVLKISIFITVISIHAPADLFL